MSDSAALREMARRVSYLRRWQKAVSRTWGCSDCGFQGPHTPLHVGIAGWSECGSAGCGASWPPDAHLEGLREELAELRDGRSVCGIPLTTGEAS